MHFYSPKRERKSAEKVEFPAAECVTSARLVNNDQPLDFHAYMIDIMHSSRERKRARSDARG
jgi:hypothetical protein